eukprot:7191260-Prymnesium_polylepis.1
MVHMTAIVPLGWAPGTESIADSTSAWRMRVQWPASAPSAAASWSARNLRSRCRCCSRGAGQRSSAGAEGGECARA